MCICLNIEDFGIVYFHDRDLHTVTLAVWGDEKIETKVELGYYHALQLVPTWKNFTTRGTPRPDTSGVFAWHPFHEIKREHGALLRSWKYFQLNVEC